MSEDNKNLVEDVNNETTEDEFEDINNEATENEDFTEETVNDNPKRKKKEQIIVISVFLVLMVALFVAVFISNKKETEKQNELYSVKYANAEKYLQDGRYDEAISAFSEISEYGDSSQRIVEVKNLKIEKLIKDAQAVYDSGDKMKAYNMLEPESENEKVSALLVKYKKAIIAEAQKKVFWEDDDMSDERLIHAKTELDHWASDTRNLIVHVYYWHKEDGSKKIILRVLFADETKGYGFTPPVHPTGMKFKSDKGEMDFSVNFMDTKFEPLVYGSGWKEDVYVEMSLEEANSFAGLFKESDKVRIRVKGAQRHIDFTMNSKDAKGIIDIVEYINVVSKFDV